MVINLRTDLNIPKNNLWYTMEKRQRESVGFEPFDKVRPVGIRKYKFDLENLYHLY